MSIVGADPNAYFFPASREIAAITNAPVAQVTTTFAHGYVTGIILRLYIPPAYGMTQANFLSGTIEVTSPTTFTITIDTSKFDPFVVPAPNQFYINSPAQCVPFGEENDTLEAAFRNILTPLF